ncbi:MAG: FGGY-family carbohydrate kinase, partial [Anaerolineaceae bacterium]
EIMPPVFEGTCTTGLLTRDAAEALGLPANIPVAAGGGDQSAAAVGCGAVEPGILSISLGTSGVVFAPTDRPVIEPRGRLHAFCHAVPDRWHLMGVMLSAAGSLRWLRDTLAPNRPYDELTTLAAQEAPGSEGVLFLPYLTGERTPVADPLARGAFTGLSVRHGLGHLTRAVLEGVAFGLRGSYDLMKEAGLAAVAEIRITGGGARSPLWRQIIADVLGCGLATVNTEEGAAYGAALLAAVGAGVWADVPSACRAVVRVTESIIPDAEQVAFYDDLYARYQGLYPALKSFFD